MKIRTFLTIILLSIMIIFPNAIKNMPNGVTTKISTNDVTILVLMDNNFGANYLPILNQFDEFGWTVDTAGPVETLTGCEYNSAEFEVDYLFSEISTSAYDCINILPGSSHENLMANQNNILNKIKTASDTGVIISAWCRAVRVLAAANVINGKNVTGHSDYASEYAAAGATFFSNVSPIISGNIVTCSSTQFYLREMYIAMTQAIGCYEDTEPVIGIIEVQTFENLSRLLTVNITDESRLRDVKAILNLISSDDDTLPPPIALTLQDPEMDNNYSVLFAEPDDGLYSVDLKITDLFWNEYLYTNITTIVVGDINKLSLGIIITIISFPIFVCIVLIKRKKCSYK
ncbi:MAG: DJ-1/PfpI family protein [Candidatus Heimdallarchaeota archaeon]